MFSAQFCMQIVSCIFIYLTIRHVFWIKSNYRKIEWLHFGSPFPMVCLNPLRASLLLLMHVPKRKFFALWLVLLLNNRLKFLSRIRITPLPYRSYSISQTWITHAFCAYCTLSIFRCAFLIFCVSIHYNCVFCLYF